MSRIHEALKRAEQERAASQTAQKVKRRLSALAASSVIEAQLLPLVFRRRPILQPDTVPESEEEPLPRRYNSRNCGRTVPGHNGSLIPLCSCSAIPTPFSRGRSNSELCARASISARKPAAADSIGFQRDTGRRQDLRRGQPGPRVGSPAGMPRTSHRRRFSIPPHSHSVGRAGNPGVGRLPAEWPHRNRGDTARNESRLCFIPAGTHVTHPSELISSSA